MLGNLPPEQGRVRVIVVADPSVGGEFSIDLPTGVRWEIKTVTGLLTTDANSGNRIPRLQIKDGSIIVAEFASDFVLLASDDMRYLWGPGLSQVTTNPTSASRGIIVAGLRLVDKMTIGSTTPSLRAGDQWSEITLLVEEWLDETTV